MFYRKNNQNHPSFFLKWTNNENNHQKLRAEPYELRNDKNRFIRTDLKTRLVRFSQIWFKSSQINIRFEFSQVLLNILVKFSTR